MMRSASNDSGKNPTIPDTSEQGPGRIRLLSDALIDQIAAGEVVERPASVVKELVENSLDAGAKRIRVAVRDGGAAMISVSDDGAGMFPAELSMAVQRHATSKLASADDLMRIRSFGFRGEALPAIASVSRFRIFSRARGQESGHEIQIDSGKLVHERPAGGPEGTRIEVVDLFSSVPARRKFLKRPGTEWGHIADWLSRLAMVRPEIHIESQRDDRKPTIWAACSDQRDRIAALLSDEDAAALIEVDYETPDCRVHAFVSTPERTRPNGQALYLFVNGRPVRDRLLRHAFVEAYRDLLPRGRFPIGVLLLEISPALVDVNVHPAKWEVRFVDPQSIHRAIRHAIRDAMSSRSWLGGGRGPAPAFDPSHSGLSSPTFSASSSFRTSTYARDAARSEAKTDDWVFAGSADRVREGNLESESERLGVLAPADGEPDRPVPSFGSLRILGQLHASYLLAESDRGLMVIDQHAAHERILYERLRRDWLESGVIAQGLLAPVTVSLPPASIAALEAAEKWVGRLGFEVESFGEGSVLVRAIPAELSGQDVTGLITELASALEATEGEALEDASAIRSIPTLDRLFATLACHAARRFGDRLPPEEQSAILNGLDTIPWAPTCPHGRPVAILIDQADLETRFRRR